jgi:hypothetical protein
MARWGHGCVAASKQRLPLGKSLLLKGHETIMASQNLPACWRRERAMRLLGVFVLTLFLVGCAADGQSHWWDAALKDLRGDNMEMRDWPSTPRN